MEQTQLTQQDFSARLGISPASLSGIFNGRTNPTNNHVQAIHRAFPNVNVNWLLFGEGNMLTSPTEASTGSKTEGAGVGAAGTQDVSSGASLGGDEAAFAPLMAVDAASYQPDLFSDSVSDCQARTASCSTSRQAAAARETRVAGVYSAMNAEFVKKIDKPMRRIREIRVFFDDGTYESFVPSSK